MAAKACDEKKAKDIKLIKIDKVSFISEWILIAEGLSDVQVRSITNSVEGELREKAKIEPIRKEGVNEAKWALLDYGDLIVNIFQPEISCLLYTSPSPRDMPRSRMPSSA